MGIRVLFSLSRLAIAVLGIAAFFSSEVPTSAATVVRITNDGGGNIGAYWSRFQAMRQAGDDVVIDGVCSSACTMVLGIVPHDRICVTPRATLGFHAAYRSGFLGFRVINDPATQTLMNIYPSPIRRWIERNGGLGSNMMYLSGRPLFALYRKCQ